MLSSMTLPHYQATQARLLGLRGRWYRTNDYSDEVRASLPIQLPLSLILARLPSQAMG